MQFMLDVYGSLGLNDKANQTQQQEARCDDILLACRLGGIVFRVSTLNGGPTCVVQHGLAFRIVAEAGSGKAPWRVIFE